MDEGGKGREVMLRKVFDNLDLKGLSEGKMLKIYGSGRRKRGREILSVQLECVVCESWTKEGRDEE